MTVDELADPEADELAALRGYVEKLKLDVSGLKGTIDEQVDHIHALQAERDSLKAEVERLKGLKPELGPFPPEGTGAPRYGLRWNGPRQPLAVPMTDGYWTPWHLAQAEAAEARKERLAIATTWIPPEIARKASEDGAEAMREACARLAEIEAERIKHDPSFFGLGDERLEQVALRIALQIRARSGKP